MKGILAKMAVSFGLATACVACADAEPEASEGGKGRTPPVGGTAAALSYDDKICPAWIGYWGLSSWEGMSTYYGEPIADNECASWCQQSCGAAGGSVTNFSTAVAPVSICYCE